MVATWSGNVACLQPRDEIMIRRCQPQQLHSPLPVTGLKMSPGPVLTTEMLTSLEGFWEIFVSLDDEESSLFPAFKCDTVKQQQPFYNRSAKKARESSIFQSADTTAKSTTPETASISGHLM